MKAYRQVLTFVGTTIVLFAALEWWLTVAPGQAHEPVITVIGAVVGLLVLAARKWRLQPGLKWMPLVAFVPYAIFRLIPALTEHKHVPDGLAKIELCVVSALDEKPLLSYRVSQYRKTDDVVVPIDYEATASSQAPCRVHLVQQAWLKYNLLVSAPGYQAAEVAVLTQNRADVRLKPTGRAAPSNQPPRVSRLFSRLSPPASTSYSPRLEFTMGDGESGPVLRMSDVILAMNLNGRQQPTSGTLQFVTRWLDGPGDSTTHMRLTGEPTLTKGDPLIMSYTPPPDAEPYCWAQVHGQDFGGTLKGMLRMTCWRSKEDSGSNPAKYQREMGF